MPTESGSLIRERSVVSCRGPGAASSRQVMGSARRPCGLPCRLAARDGRSGSIEVYDTFDAEIIAYGPGDSVAVRRSAGNRLKQSRAVATRYDKRGYVFLGTATAATDLTIEHSSATVSGGPLVSTRHHAAVFVEDLGVMTRVHPHCDALVMHDHVERRLLRLRLGHHRERLTRTQPVIGSPRLDPQADHAAGLVAHARLGHARTKPAT